MKTMTELITEVEQRNKEIRSLVQDNRDLEEIVEEVRRENAALQHQIGDLKTTVHHRNNYVEDLVDQVRRLSVELEQAHECLTIETQPFTVEVQLNVQATDPKTAVEEIESTISEGRVTAVYDTLGERVWGDE